MRRFLVVFLASLLIVACGGNDQPAESGTPDAAKTGGSDGGGLKPLGEGSGDAAATPAKPAEPAAPADPDVAVFRQAELWVRSGDAEDRMQAIVELRKAKDQSKAGRYVARLLADEDESVREVAAQAIADFQYAGAAESLRNLLADEKSDIVRKQAIQSLFAIEKEKAVPDLVRVLKEDPESSVQATAANLLGRSGSEEAVDPLIETLKDAFNERLQLETIAALRKLGAKKAVEPIMDALEYQSVLVRAEAAKALGELGEKKAVPALITAIGAENEDGQVLIALSESLGKLTDLPKAKREEMTITDTTSLEQQAAILEAWKSWWEEHRSEY